MSIENEYEGKIVLVTGGAGCIGTNKLFFYKVLKPLLKKEIKEIKAKGGMQ